MWLVLVSHCSLCRHTKELCMTTLSHAHPPIPKTDYFVSGCASDLFSVVISGKVEISLWFMFWRFNAFFPRWVFIFLPDQIVIKCPPPTTLPRTCPKIWTFQNILFKCPWRRSTVGVVAQHRSNILYQALIYANQYKAASEFIHIMFIYKGQDLKKKQNDLDAFLIVTPKLQFTFTV